MHDQPPHLIRVEFRPYDKEAVANLLKKVYTDFGRSKTRWWHQVAETDEPNAWILDFCFYDKNDALMFRLKYGV